MEHNQLIRTKLFIPPQRAETVPRARLTERLNSGLDKKLILISASAGFGKSTLLSQWIHQCGIPAAWFSIDEEDNDQTRFMVYLISALQTLFPDIGNDALAVQQSPQLTPMEPDLTGIINEISILSDDFVLVLDDYHHIKSEAIHSALAFFIEHLPSQLHLVIATRSDPPLPLAALLARGEMVELRSNEMRFTPEEVQVFLRQAMKINLPENEVKTLGKRTEGWIAGLRLAAISLQGRNAETIQTFIKDFAGSNRYVLDYLMEEVLQQQPQHTQDFLLKTSILKRLSAPLCDAVTGKENSQDMLEYIEHANLFVEPLDDRRCWYRYHNLFADLLRLRLQQTQPELLPILNRKASDWYENNDLISAAVYHSLATKDFEHAAILIEKASTDILVHGEVATLTAWLDALPDEITRARPELEMIRIWIKIVEGNLENIRQDIELVESKIQNLPQSIDSERRLNLETLVNACHAYLALHNGEFPLALQMSKNLLDTNNHENPFIAAFTGLFSAFEVLLNETPDQYYLPFEDHKLQKFGSANNIVFLLSISMAGFFQTLNGSLRKATRLYEYGLHATEQAVQKNRELPGSPQMTPAIGLMYQGLGDIMRRQNRLDKAQEYLDMCMHYGELWKNVEILFDNYIAYANLQLARNDIAAAEKTFDRIFELHREHSLSPITVRQWEAYLANLWIRQGRLQPVKKWSENLQEYHPEQYGNAYVSILLFNIEQIVLAHYLIACGRYEDALKQIEHVFDILQFNESVIPVIEFKIIQALAYDGNGERRKAIACLQHIMEKARSESYLRVFLDEGQPMAELLAAYRHQPGGDDTDSSFIDELLAAFAAESKTQQPDTEKLQTPVFQNETLEEPLSERELEVLGLIANGLSNKEIALEMNIALSTVKTHIHSLYRKLNVSKRTQAVAKARQHQ